MKILFTMTGSWGTGSGTVVEAVGKELIRLGHRVIVLCPEAQQDPETEDQVRAVDLEQVLWRFPVRRGDVELYTYPLMISDPNPSNFSNAWTFADLSEAQLQLYLSSFQEKLEEVIARFEPDVIECEHVWAMPYVVSQIGHPYLCVAHHSDQMAFHYDERMRPYAVEAARSAEYVFAISDAVREEVMQLYGIPEAQVPLIYNGYDQDLFQPRPVDRAALFQEYGLSIPPDAPVVTFAGKLSKTKGVDVLLLANRLIQAQREVHFVLFGTGSLDEALDEGLADRYSQENVHLLGHQPYEVIARFHNAARLSVMPSRTEGFGIAGLEAMGCGVPLVITRTGGLDLYAVGEVIEPEDVEALAGAILRLVNLPEDRYAALRREAAEQARAFCWGSITEQRLTYYEEVAERTRAYFS